MFVNQELNSHLEESSTIQTQSLVTAEWNMNIASNISIVGNYRYRPNDSTSKYNNILNTYDTLDSARAYTDATTADILIDGGFEDSGIPQVFTSKKEKDAQLFSLEDCFNKFRPRSGINKLVYFENKKIHHSNRSMSNRPRYYVSDKNDFFKYWTSYRTEIVYKYTYTSGLVAYGSSPTFIDNDAKNTVKDGVIFETVERGVAKHIVSGKNYIQDAAPFVVYKEAVPANRIVIKMQTNVGTVDLGPFSSSSAITSDPLYGFSNQTTPTEWSVQFLENNNWINAISFKDTDRRKDGSQIIGPDGYVELSYGLIIPPKYATSFVFGGVAVNKSLIPVVAPTGYGFIVQSSETDIGTLYIYNGEEYEESVPNYGWKLEQDEVSGMTNFVNRLVDARSFSDPVSGSTRYRDFNYLQGLRLVAKTMNKFDSTLDLIELSPRLTVNVTPKVTNFSITKAASDLGATALPVGQLLASTGDLSMLDYDEAFNSNNSGSIISKYLANTIKFSFYDITRNVNGYDYYVPIKTLFSEGIPKDDIKNRSVSVQLRDMFFYLESITAPSLFLTNVSLTFAISTMLDYIGFSNYSFKRLTSESDLMIPFFFVSPDKNIAQVLNDLAVSSQTAMFFDEYNNFILMSKNYMLPEATQRDIDLTLYGSSDSNNPTKLPNILNVSSVDNKVYNDGKINYTTRYIQRSYGSLKQASMIDQDKNWIYKPALLWEVSGTQNTKSTNGSVSDMSNYVLSAMPLRSDLSSAVPTVVNNALTNNIMDFGENVYWLSRYSGYFYANGEVIKFDAAQFNVSKVGNVWINNVQEYQYYFSKLPFNGKMYPTGLVRIYAEPDYEIVNGITKLKDGPVKKHGRGQFGTSITSHVSGINSYWTSDASVQGCKMSSKYLFGSETTIPATDVLAAGVQTEFAKKSVRTSIIKNFMTNSFISEYDNSKMLSTQSGTIQSSALVMSGPSFKTEESPVDYLSYVYKNLGDKYKHFGTRLRVVGKVEANETYGQTPIGASTYYVVPSTDPNKSITVGGGSGGLAVMVNPTTNVGYYFELIALTDNNIDSYSGNDNGVRNLIFYKIKRDSSTNEAIPIKLWDGLGKVIVDDGNFTGQYRMNGEENPTVYDISVEYLDVGKTRKFYLYVNNVVVAVVDDTDPLPVYNNMGLFVRGSSKLMFENIYALSENYSQNVSNTLDLPISNIFNNQEMTSNDAFRKYAMSAIVQSTYLSGVSPSQPPTFKLYFDEFGTIMRECSYFNIRYDKAYPALYAKLSPTFNKIKGYTVSGFQANAYGAEFMIFNATDTALNLDETSGNYLRIQGVTFTQDNNNELTVDDFYNLKGNLSDPQFSADGVLKSPYEAIDIYNKIKLSRTTYGKNQFSVEVPYVQTKDDADNLMSWLTKKLIKPRKSVGVEIFSNPTLQLGDIVNIHYKDNDGNDVIASDDSRFIVYNINYTRDLDGPNMTVYLSEVPND